MKSNCHAETDLCLMHHQSREYLWICQPVTLGRAGGWGTTRDIHQLRLLLSLLRFTVYNPVCVCVCVCVFVCACVCHTEEEIKKKSLCLRGHTHTRGSLSVTGRRNRAGDVDSLFEVYTLQEAHEFMNEPSLSLIIHIFFFFFTFSSSHAPFVSCSLAGFRHIYIKLL